VWGVVAEDYLERSCYCETEDFWFHFSIGVVAASVLLDLVSLMNFSVLIDVAQDFA